MFQWSTSFQLIYYIPNCGESYEAEVSGFGGGPALPGRKQDRADENESKNQHQVNHDGNHHQVCRHVSLLADLVEADTLCSPIHIWW